MAIKTLSSGAHSTVYTDENEPGIVIKKAKDPTDTNYLKKQLRGYDVINSIKAQGYDVGVMLPELVAADDKEQTIREKIMPGATFDSNGRMYFSLSEQQKNDMALQMATFLNAMHSSSECKPAQDFIINIRKEGPANADEIIAKFEGMMPKKMANKLKQAEEYLHTSDNSDEFIVMTHTDLRASNLMYDINTNKLAVIDFESAKPDNIYRDFVASASASSMPWDFIKRVINFYNQIPNKKHPIKINPEKVQNALLYLALHEYAYCFAPGNFKQFPSYISDRLEMITGIEFDATQTFKNANKKAQDAGNNNIIASCNNTGHGI